MKELFQALPLSGAVCTNLLLGAGKPNFTINQETRTTALHMLARTLGKTFNPVVIRYAFQTLHCHFRFRRELLDVRDRLQRYPAPELAGTKHSLALVEITFGRSYLGRIEPEPQRIGVGHRASLAVLTFPKGPRVKQWPESYVRAINCCPREEKTGRTALIIRP